MSRVEEMTVVRASIPQVMRLLTSGRFDDWIAPDVTATPVRLSPTLAPGDRFRIEILASVSFDYLTEAITDREVVFSFSGPWSGRERWSFIPDGAETIVRRVYQIDETAPLPLLAWRTVGRPIVSAHFKLELARFREAIERDPGPRAEIESGERGAPTPPPAPPSPGSFPIDEG